MPELVPQSMSAARLSCGLQLAWSQHNMSLIAGGDYKVRRGVWQCVAMSTSFRIFGSGTARAS